MIKRIIIGFGNFIPTIIIITSLLLVLVLKAYNMNDEIPVELRIPVITWIILLFVSVILEWFLIIFYMLHINSKNKKINSEKKVLWIISIFLFNIISIPIYWFKYIDIDYRK